MSTKSSSRTPRCRLLPPCDGLRHCASAPRSCGSDCLNNYYPQPHVATSFSSASLSTQSPWFAKLECR
eukprot:CAMPEP_0194366332 /NCGR_PEP_ID=MMETSP0174-20130528/14372_1 /TAXON_ID=216777 /ORGANISM="Proboscia alata, Strain PI-D3" /LENGTH=67 /DNA_ID=CAMNT_0039141465 /DNA_START=804 /DNA_END=1007 /DNA_ORIENTATION=-